MIGLVPLQEETPKSSLSPPSENIARRQPLQVRKEPLPRIESDGTLILHPQTPELLESKHLLFKSPSLWYFVMAA